MSPVETTPRVPRAFAPDQQPLPTAVQAASESDSDLTELRRALLIYGTAGQAARSPGMETRLI